MRISKTTAGSHSLRTSFCNNMKMTKTSHQIISFVNHNLSHCDNNYNLYITFCNEQATHILKGAIWQFNNTATVQIPHTTAIQQQNSDTFKSRVLKGICQSIRVGCHCKVKCDLNSTITRSYPLNKETLSIRESLSSTSWSYALRIIWAFNLYLRLRGSNPY